MIVHDWGTLILMFLVAGHLYLAVLHPATRHALRGMTLGDVDEDVGAAAPLEVGRAGARGRRARVAGICPRATHLQSAR